MVRRQRETKHYALKQKRKPDGEAIGERSALRIKKRHGKYAHTEAVSPGREGIPYRVTIEDGHITVHVNDVHVFGGSKKKASHNPIERLLRRIKARSSKGDQLRDRKRRESSNAADDSWLITLRLEAFDEHEGIALDDLTEIARSLEGLLQAALREGGVEAEVTARVVPPQSGCLVLNFVVNFNFVFDPAIVVGESAPLEVLASILAVLGFFRLDAPNIWDLLRDAKGTLAEFMKRSRARDGDDDRETSNRSHSDESFDSDSALNAVASEEVLDKLLDFLEASMGPSREPVALLARRRGDFEGEDIASDGFQAITQEDVESLQRLMAELDAKGRRAADDEAK